MQGVWFYTILSVFIVSIISFVGVLTLSIKTEKLKKFLIFLVSFSAGALLGDAFIHLLPEVIEESGFTLLVSGFVLSGIFFSLFIEKIIHWNHCHMPITKGHVHTFSIMNLVGDGVHNFIDGLIIGASYLVSIPVGIATTIAVVLHEIPQEIGDFGVLLHGGFTKKKALFSNFLTAVTAIIGAIVALLLSSSVENLVLFLVPFAAGNFIYIACTDLIPELHKDSVKISHSLLQVVFFLLGIAVMFSLILLE